MTNPLDYAPPDPRSIARRRIGWVTCLVSMLLSLGAGAGSIRLAFYFRRPVGFGVGLRDQYWYIDKQMNLIGAPIIFCLAAIGCWMCWRSRTGPWLSFAALLVGVACWIGAVRTYP